MTGSGRVEAFSDGVMAIAITLLVLDLRVPEAAPPGGLGAALNHEWPSYLAYVVSFLVIGIMWVNHHAIFTSVRQVDRLVLFVNLLLLLLIAALPFPTQLLAAYLREGGRNSHVAAAVYSGLMLLIAIAFTGLWVAVTRDNELLNEPMTPTQRSLSVRRFGTGIVIYALTIGLAFVSAPLTLAVHGALALFYCFDQRGAS